MFQTCSRLTLRQTYAKWCKQTKIQQRDVIERSNKLNKIWLKRLNPHIYIVEGLN